MYPNQPDVKHFPQKCDATNCPNTAIGFIWETKEVPAWRHPVDMIGQRVFNAGFQAFYCLDHEEIAMTSNT
jgi:hypothetical protein